MSRPLFLLGNSGLAQEIAELLEACDQDSQWRLAGMLAVEEQWRVVDAPCDVLLAMGYPRVREAVVQTLASVTQDRWPTLLHPRSDVSRSAALGAGTVIASGSLVSSSVTVGSHCLINYGATVGHDARIGNFSVVNPNASISGGAVIGEACLVGAGATILERVVLGDGVIVGAGAVVLGDVPAGLTVVGVPARTIRTNGDGS